MASWPGGVRLCRLVEQSSRWTRVRVFIGAIPRRALSSPYTGLVATIILTIWEAFWLVGPPVGVDARARNQYLSWGLVAIFVAYCQTFLRQRAQIRDYERRFEPKTALVFRPDNANHVQHGTVTRQVNLGGYPASIPCDEYLYALGVVNLSATAIAGCRLVLEWSDPHDTSQHRRGRAMRVRDDPNKESDGVFMLKPHDGRQPSAYVEVLREVVPQQTHLRESADIQIRHANSLFGHPNWSTDRGEHRLRFRLEGEMAQAVMKRGTSATAIPASSGGSSCRWARCICSAA
jgi:hypothetical protein